MITVRKFSPADLEKVTKLSKISFPKNKNLISARYLERYFKKYPAGFFVAESSDGQIAGYAIGCPKKNSAEFVSLAVHPDFRKKGIGTHLANSLLNHFKEKKVNAINLQVRTSNKTALSFHKSLGFKIVKTAEKYYRNGDDAYLMEKNLEKDG